MRHHLIFISIILFLTGMGIAAGTLSSERHERTGSSSKKHMSLPNAMVSAHFRCNREGLWANMDTLQVVDTYTSQYKMAGGRKNVTDYYTKVNFECTPEYTNSPTPEQ